MEEVERVIDHGQVQRLDGLLLHLAAALHAPMLQRDLLLLQDRLGAVDATVHGSEPGAHGGGQAGGAAAHDDAAVDRIAAAVADIEHLSLPAAAAREAREQLAAQGLAGVSIQATPNVSEQIDAAVELREEVGPGETVDGVTPFLVGQPAAWAGLQELSKEDLESAVAINSLILQVARFIGPAIAGLLLDRTNRFRREAALLFLAAAIILVAGRAVSDIGGGSMKFRFEDAGLPIIGHQAFRPSRLFQDTPFAVNGPF